MDSDVDVTHTITTSTAIISHAMTLFTACSSVMPLFRLLINDLQKDYNGDHSVNSSIPKISLLDNPINRNVSPMKFNTGFFPRELEGLREVTCPVIPLQSFHTHHVHATSAGRKCQLSPRQRVFTTIFLLPGCNRIHAEIACWNDSRASFRDECMFICSIMNKAMASQIAWPTSEQKKVMHNRNPFLSGVLRIC